VKKSFTLATLVIIVMLGLWSAINRPGEKLPEPVKDPHFIDFFINAFKMTSMDETGRPAYILTGSRMEHFNDTGESLVTDPVFMFSQNMDTWELLASQGHIDDDNIWVKLSDGVVIRQTDKVQPMLIKTSELRINTRAEIANTDRPVAITQGMMQITAEGMVLDNNKGTLVLLENVKGIYIKN